MTISYLDQTERKPERRWISCADTAKLVREALKKTFPGEKFSVTSKTYSGGASITVRWTDGRAEYEVEKVVGQFSGATFDGMIDLKEYHDSELNGEAVHYGADFIFCQRDYSRELTQRMAERIAKFEKIETPVMNDYDWYSDDITVHCGSRDKYFTNTLRQALGEWSETRRQFVGDRSGHVAQYFELLTERETGEPKEMTAALGQKPDPTGWYRRSLQQVSQQLEATVASEISPEPETFPSGVTSHVRLETYKGHPIIVIGMPDGQDVRFGLKKAQAILDNLEAIQSFVKDNS